jgi:hypothetical protein
LVLVKIWQTFFGKHNCNSVWNGWNNLLLPNYSHLHIAATICRVSYKKLLTSPSHVTPSLFLSHTHTFLTFRDSTVKFSLADCTSLCPSLYLSCPYLFFHILSAMYHNFLYLFLCTFYSILYHLNIKIYTMGKILYYKRMT